MTDLTLTLDTGGLGVDFSIVANDLATDEGLRSAVVVSLFSDALARPDDAIPDGTENRRGWWGDIFPPVAGDRTGSRLWLLSREKELPVVLDRAREYATEALNWLLEDGVADAVEVSAEIVRPGMLGLTIVIRRSAGGRVDLRFDYAWQAEMTRED